MDTVEIWRTARDLAGRLRRITELMAERIEGGEVEALPSLLEERWKICRRLDELRTPHGIASWVTGETSTGDLPEDVAAARREIEEIFRWLMAEDERLRGRLEQMMGAVRKDLEEVKRIKQAHRLYRGDRLLAGGFFVDSRR